MGKENVTIHAVLCDIYETLLEVGPPPADAQQRWEALCHDTLSTTPVPTLAGFAAAAAAVTQREHAAANAGGIAYPEIFWPAVAREAWPVLISLGADRLDDFLFEHAQLQHTIRLMPGAADLLRSLAARKVQLGLISNSQPYTLRELDVALAAASLSRALFVPDLCFFSFEHGFSKPDPYVFRILAARLAIRGIASSEALVVGDREDNDIAPARAQNFQTWNLGDAAAGESRGNWMALARSLALG
jgi:FMN phosphatase YigB (HAD superfamily)